MDNSATYLKCPACDHVVDITEIATVNKSLTAEVSRLQAEIGRLEGTKDELAEGAVRLAEKAVKAEKVAEAAREWQRQLDVCTEYEKGVE